VVLFGLALMVGGVGVLIGLREELGIRLPAFLAAPLEQGTAAVRRAVSPRAPAPAAPPAVGRATVPGQTAVQERVLRRLQSEREHRRSPAAGLEETGGHRPVSLPRAVGRATPPPSSLERSGGTGSVYRVQPD
jgi:hypothetical protein